MTAACANPLSLFDVEGKVAIVTGASGAFGALAAEILAAAGAKLVLAAGKAKELDEIARQMPRASAPKSNQSTGGPPARPPANAIVEAAEARFGRVDILVVASGKNDVAKIVDMAPERFLDVMDANVTQSWLMARAAGKQMLAQGRGRQDRADVLRARPARPSRRLYRLLRLEGGDRRHHPRAGLRMGADRHHRQCDRADGVPLAADRLDVWRRRARQDDARRLSRPRAERPARRTGRSRRTAAVPRLAAPPTSTPATSSTPTAATRRDDHGG